MKNLSLIQKQDERVKHVLPFSIEEQLHLELRIFSTLNWKTVNDIATLEALTKEQNIPNL